ncbi:hypothetical protein DITRI_Ditri12bG0183300 [Diplodiscus trichospermus]
MSTNSMENPNGEGSDASKNEHRPQQQVSEIHLAVPNNDGHCSGGDVSMHEYGAQLNVNLDRLGTDSLIRYLRHYKIEGFDSDSSREEMLNAVTQHFASQPPLDENQVIPEFIDAAKKRYCCEADASEDEHDWPQQQVDEVQLDAEDNYQQQVNEAQLEEEDYDQDLTKTLCDIMKDAKNDSPKEERHVAVLVSIEESVLNEANPAVPNNEDHCLGRDVSMFEHVAQYNVNLDRLETDSLRRYLRHFEIEGINSDSSREEMLNAVQQHFASQPPLNERQMILEFIDAPRKRHWQANEAQQEAGDSDRDLMETIRDFRKKGAKPDSTKAQRLGPVIGNFEEPVNERNPAVPNNEGHCTGGDISMREQRAQLNVNLDKLETDSLKRYISHYKIEGINSDSSREEMLNAVQQHFASQPPPDEQQVIPEFMKRLGY